MVQPREQFTAEEYSIVLSHYDIGTVSSVRDFPRGSHSSPKVLITSSRGKFLLKRRPKGKHDPYRVAFAHSLQNYLASKNFPLPHLVGTREQNNSMLKIGDALYEMFEFIEGVPFSGSLVSTYEAGKTLALYHALVHNYHSEWEPPHGHYHDSGSVVEAFGRMERVLAKTPSGAESEREVHSVLAELRDAYRRAAQAVNKMGMPEWEEQIVHSDWHPGNMIFQDDHVVAVIDFDAARIRPRVMDVGNGCLQFSMTTGGRDLASWEDRTDEQRAKRFLRGYDEINVLSKAEMAVIPLLMQEAMIAQTVPPILKTGTFGGLDGFGFLKVLVRKVRWLQANGGRLNLDVEE